MRLCKWHWDLAANQDLDVRLAESDADLNLFAEGNWSPRKFDL